MNVAAVKDMPTLTVSMPDVGGTEDITTKQRMMSSCTGAILTSFFSQFFCVFILAMFVKMHLCTLFFSV